MNTTFKVGDYVVLTNEEFSRYGHVGQIITMLPPVWAYPYSVDFGGAEIHVKSDEIRLATKSERIAYQLNQQPVE